MAIQQHTALLWCYCAEILLNWLFSHLRPTRVWSDCGRRWIYPSTSAWDTHCWPQCHQCFSSGCSMQMKTSTLSLKPCSVCLQQRGFPLKRGRQLCRFPQFLFVAVHGCWELLPSYRMKLTPRHSRSGSHVVAKQMCSATEILLIWWVLSCSQNGEHEQMPEESPEIAGGALPSNCTPPCNPSLAPMGLHSLYQILSCCQQMIYWALLRAC